MQYEITNTARGVSLSPDDLDLIGSDLGDRTRAVVTEAALRNDRRRMLSIILGSPDFQQQ